MPFKKKRTLVETISRPNFAKVLVEIDLAKNRRDSIWVGVVDGEGQEHGGFKEGGDQDSNNNSIDDDVSDYIEEDEYQETI
ncbi:hypothetical protein H5410_026822 [Solanum commersonii]|uniref:Uncharacterized protein n=1 Tax=Solanum commersonii TaxID=4109 RepID=A0A9J5YY61_SOLCO|nr:hypothetical protein H5410_026822 [Solanum commersonii]